MMNLMNQLDGECDSNHSELGLSGIFFSSVNTKCVGDHGSFFRSCVGGHVLTPSS